MAFIGLELYAIALALVQYGHGVHTDEAKYLLSIPYPHPPLVRWIFSQFDAWSGQELFVRIVLATLLVQAVWLVWDMARQMNLMCYGTGDQKNICAGPPWMFPVSACVLYLISTAVVAQAGTVMMAPLTAVQGLIFLWLLTRMDFAERYSGVVSLLWLASLFTAYQVVLFLPVVAVLFLKMKIPAWQKLVGLLGPLVLLTLYTPTNPLIPASMFLAGTQNADLSFAENLQRALKLGGIGGSVILSVLGTLAMARSKHPAIASLFLVTLYVMISYRPYYAILFTPLLIAGLISWPDIMCRPLSKVFLTAVVTVLLVTSTVPIGSPAPPAREVMGSILQSTTSVAAVPEPPLRDRLLLIDGYFGHEWQYESPWPVRRYREDLVPEAVAVVCTQECPEVVLEGSEKLLIRGMTVQTR